ncbi:hypothetical protein ACTPEO_05345 [Clostridioides difficile]
MFKKILLVLMIGVLGFGVVGCSDNKEDTNEVANKETEEKLDEENTSEDIYNKKLQFLNNTISQSETIGDEVRLLTEKYNNYEIVKSDWKEELINKKKIITDLKGSLEEEKSNILDGVSDFQKTILQNKYNEIIEYYDYMLKGISQNLDI